MSISTVERVGTKSAFFSSIVNRPFVDCYSGCASHTHDEASFSNLRLHDMLVKTPETKLGYKLPDDYHQCFNDLIDQHPALEHILLSDILDAIVYEVSFELKACSNTGSFTKDELSEKVLAVSIARSIEVAVKSHAWKSRRKAECKDKPLTLAEALELPISEVYNWYNETNDLMSLHRFDPMTARDLLYQCAVRFQRFAHVSPSPDWDEQVEQFAGSLPRVFAMPADDFNDLMMLRAEGCRHVERLCTTDADQHPDALFVFKLIQEGTLRTCLQDIDDPVWQSSYASASTTGVATRDV